jgi:transposase-like protein
VQKKSSAAGDDGSNSTPRIPVESDGIQLNFCKTPTCSNYGIPPEQVASRGPGSSNRYIIVSAGQGMPMARCNACGESFLLKSNIGIIEERNRFRPVFKEPCCPHDDCEHHGIGVSAGKPVYSSFGQSEIGSKRWKCMACKRTFSVKAKSTSRQRDTHKNKEIFALLVNKTPLRRIVELAQVSPQTVYDKIDFLWHQCVDFCADRESKLPELKVPRLYIGVDKQDYTVNWTRRDDKRNVIMSAVSFVDNATGYALGTWLNFDPSVDVEAVESLAVNESERQRPFRTDARLWTSLDYTNSVKVTARYRASRSLEENISQQYEQAAQRTDVEALDAPTINNRLPEHGMQVHTEYLLYGAFLRLKEMLSSVEKVRFFLDQDSGMRAACLGGWFDRVVDRSCDAFYVSISKSVTVDRKRKLSAQSRDEVLAVMAALGCTRSEAVLTVLKDRIAHSKTLGKWNDRWVFHPQATMSEPEKALCHLTDLGDYDEDHLAWLYNKASLHGVDSYFNRIRRRVSLLERGIHTSANAGKVWNGYAPYNPQQVQKLLDIFRTCHNFMWTRDVFKGEVKEKKTPAMLIGLAKGVVTYEDVIYWRRS